MKEPNLDELLGVIRGKEPTKRDKDKFVDAKAKVQAFKKQSKKTKSFTNPDAEVFKSFTIKGRVMKQAMGDITPHLSGVLRGLAGDVVSEDEMVVWLLDRANPPKIVASEFLRWKGGEVTHINKGKSKEIEYVIPRGKSLGVFVDKDENILVPLKS